MLGIAFGLALWVPAIIGWGVAARVVTGAGWRRERFELADIPAGYLALTAIVIALNFAVGIRGVVSGVVVAIGIVIALAAFREVPTLREPRVVAGAMVTVLLVALIAAQPVHYSYDAMLYHLQTMAWAREDAMPRGLYNLHGRLAFNSAWLPLAALVSDPFDAQPLEHAILLPGTVACFVPVVARRCWHIAREGALAGRIGLVSLLALTTQTVATAINTTANDFVPFFAWLGAIATFAWMREGRDSAPARSLGAIAALSAVGVTAKVSALPIGLLLFAAIVVAVRRHRVPRAAVARALAIPALAVALWSGRGVVLSGCGVFPVAATCTDTVSWAAGRAQVRVDATVLRDWARTPWQPKAEPTPAWIPDWFERHRKSPDVLTAVALLLAGAVAWIGSRPRQGPNRDTLLMCGIAVAGIVAWLIGAPDPRFGMGPLWALGAIVFATAGAAAFPFGTPLRPIAAVWLLVAVAWAPLLTEGLRLATRPLRNPGIAALVAPARPVIVATPQMSTRVIASGDTVRMPMPGDDRCYLAPIPCMPYWREGLVALRDASGAIREFRMPR